MEIVVRATAIYFFLWALTRGLGKRELAEMTAFELVLLMVMGDLIQQGVTQEDTSITGAILAVGTIGIWILAFSWLGYRFRPARHLIEGVPVVVVQEAPRVCGFAAEVATMQSEDHRRRLLEFQERSKRT